MKSRAEVDPELHLLRSAVRIADGQSRQELESARFNLYSAFEHRDADDARRWAKALRTALLMLECANQRDGEVREFALQALDTIERGI